MSKTGSLIRRSIESSRPASAGDSPTIDQIYDMTTTTAPAKSAKRQTIPEGMHTITPHLICAGAAEAIEFYKKAFGAEERLRLDTPDGKLMHGNIRIGDSSVMLVDENAAHGMLGPKALKGSPVTIHLQVVDADATFAQAVAAGAKVLMPLADMFWGDRFGLVEDPFGHYGSIATRIQDLTPEQMKAAARNACQ